MRKAEMSMQTVVIAVVLLLIAVLLIFLVTKHLHLFDNGIGECQGTCQSSCDKSQGEIHIPTGDSYCKDKGGVCCMNENSI